MQEKHLFEYAVIRVVPHVEREEFVNVGIVLLCAKQKYLKAMIDLEDEKLVKKLRALCAEVDLEDLRGYLTSFQKICQGGKDGGPIGQLSQAERFRWLTATRSTIVQTSMVHPGLCDDPEERIQRLYRQLVN